MPISYPVHANGLVVFAGRRWIVEDIDERTNTLHVAPHVGGVAPRFESTSFEPTHDRLAAEMRAVYLDTDIPHYLEGVAQGFLAAGRATFLKFELGRRSLIEKDGDFHVFLWRGTQACAVFESALAMCGASAEAHDCFVTISKTTFKEGILLLEKLGSMDTLTSNAVAEFVKNIRLGKFREFVPESLARLQWARQNSEVVIEIPALARALSQDVSNKCAPIEESNCRVT